MLKEVTHNKSEGDLFLTSMEVMINLTLTEGSKSGFDIFTVRFLINISTCQEQSTGSYVYAPGNLNKKILNQGCLFGQHLHRIRVLPSKLCLWNKIYRMQPLLLDSAMWQAYYKDKNHLNYGCITVPHII